MHAYAHARTHARTHVFLLNKVSLLFTVNANGWGKTRTEGESNCKTSPKGAFTLANNPFGLTDR